MRLPWDGDSPPSTAASAGMPRQWGPMMKTSSLPPSERATLRKLLEKELQCGALRVADPREVAALTPIHVVKSGAASKPRLIHDLRPINAWLKPPCRTEFERVRDALALGVAYGTKIDLMNAFSTFKLTRKIANC